MDSFLNISRGGNTSIQWGQYNVLGESDHHLLQAHGSVLPVLLIEAISSEGKLIINILLDEVTVINI